MTRSTAIGVSRSLSSSSVASRHPATNGLTNRGLFGCTNAEHGGLNGCELSVETSLAGRWYTSKGFWYTIVISTNPRAFQMTIDQQISDLKVLLDQLETEYAYTIASGDWVACSTAKGKVAKVRSRVGKLIKVRMGMA